MKTIIVIILAAIIVACGWSGYKKGIIMGVGGVLAIIVSLYGAKLLANTFSHDIISAMRPFISGFVESQINNDDETDSIMAAMGWENSNYSVDDLLESNPERKTEFAAECYKCLGVYGRTAENLAEKAVEYSAESGCKMSTAVVQITCETVSFVGCFLLAFLLILILLTVIGNLPNLSYKIPNLDILNDIGGIVLGLVTGIMFCAVIVWTLKFGGKLIGTDTLSSSMFTRIFLNNNMLSNYLGI